MGSMDCLLKIILLLFCFILGSVAIEDSLYQCSEWHKQCVEEDSESTKQGELKIISGQYFNCYFGYTPKCYKDVPKDTKKPEDYCEDLDSASEFESTNSGRCIVNAKAVDDDADHTLLFTSLYS